MPDGVEALVECFYDYLADTKHCVLWATWDISRDDSREAAAQWFVKEMLAFNEWID